MGKGMKVGNAIYYYTRDHLGSVRELTNSSGAVQTRYDYDPYGRRTKLSGSIDADFGFTGHYYHQPSGLHLALYRAYDADLGRWISRDLVEQAGGRSLYQYVTGNPCSRTDALGLFPTNPVMTAFNFLSQYFAMRNPNTPPVGPNRDKYFHCMANCTSAKAGGILDSLAIDIGRELSDNVKNACRKPKKLSADAQLQDSLNDMGANLEGLKAGLNPFQNCASTCSGLL